MYDQWFTIALLTSGFGQVRLHNCAVADKGPIEEYYRDLDKAGIKKIA